MPKSDNFRFVCYEPLEKTRFFEAAAALTGFKIRVYKHLSRIPTRLRGCHPESMNGFSSDGRRRVALCFSIHQHDWSPFWIVVEQLELEARERPDLYGDEVGSFLV